MDPCASVEQTESTRLFRSECVCIDEWMVHYGKQHDPDLQSAAVQPETGSLNSDKSPKQVGEKSKIYRCKSCINLNDSLVRLHPPIQKWINAWIILTKHNSRRLMLTFSVHVASKRVSQMCSLESPPRQIFVNLASKHIKLELLWTSLRE